MSSQDLSSFKRLDLAYLNFLLVYFGSICQGFTKTDDDGRWISLQMNNRSEVVPPAARDNSPPRRLGHRSRYVFVNVCLNLRETVDVGVRLSRFVDYRHIGQPWL